MSSARLKSIAIAVGGALALLSCATQQMGGVAKTSNGINLGATGPHVVQPLPDKPRFGQAVSDADIAAWNIDVRTPDGKGLPPGRGTVAEGSKVYAAKCVACHGP